MLLVCICSNLKPVLRNKFVTLAIILTHYIYNSMLFFDAQRGLRAKRLGKAALDRMGNAK